MSGKLVFSAVLTFLLIGVFMVAFRVHEVKAGGTIYIRSDGSVDPPYAPISTVDNVTYTFTDNIYDEIVVERSNIIMDGAGYKVEGTEALDSKGIYLSGVSNVTIKNVNIKHFYYGIYLYESSDNVLSGNNVTANNWNGIFLGYSSNSTLSGNVMGSNRYNFGVAGDALSHYLQSVDTSNLVDGKPVYYFMNQSDMVVNADAYPEVGYLGFVNCANVTVQGLNLTNNGQGLLLAFTNDSKITGNNVTNNWDGIALTYSPDNVLSGNNVTANDEDGIRLVYSSNNSITGNNITNNGSNGIYLYSSSDNTISNNTLMSNRWVGFSVQSASIIQQASNNTFMNNNVTGSDCGFQFWGMGEYYNTVENNIVYSNGAGIQLGDNARYTTLRGNTLSNNYYGLMIMNGPEGSKNYGNKIFHNSFINNTQQVYSSYSVNIWDDGYPSGGNYWSDYNGTDSDYDGIGDFPYVIDANNTDSYPLMGIFSDFNTTSEHHVQTICNSSITDFQFNGIAILFNVSGADGTAGFCRICIPKALMNETYSVFVNGTEIIPAPLPLPCSNSTHNYLYFNYTHSKQEVVIVPEFPSFLILSLFMIATLLVILICRKKKRKLF